MCFLKKGIPMLCMEGKKLRPIAMEEKVTHSSDGTIMIPFRAVVSLLFEGNKHLVQSEYGAKSKMVAFRVGSRNGQLTVDSDR